MRRLFYVPEKKRQYQRFSSKALLGKD